MRYSTREHPRANLVYFFYSYAIFDDMTDVNIKMFADDCVLYKSVVRWDDIHDPLQRMLNTYIK